MIDHISIALLLVLIVFAAFRIAQDIVRRSMNSFKNAELVWNEILKSGRILVENDAVTPPVSRLIIKLMGMAGSGKFVRTMIFQSLVPSAFRTSKPKEGFEAIIREINHLPENLHEEFRKLLILVLLYDSYSNPVQGRAMRFLTQLAHVNDANYRTKAETEITTYHVVSRSMGLARTA